MERTPAVSGPDGEGYVGKRWGVSRG